MQFLRRIAAVWAFACLVSAVAPVAAQSDADVDQVAFQAMPSASDTGEQSLDAKGDAVANQLRVAQRELEATREQGIQESASVASLQRDVDLLKQIDVVIAQLQIAHDDAVELEARKKELAGRLRELESTSGGPTTDASFLLLDRLRDELATLTERSESTQADLAAAQEAATEAEEFNEEQQQRFRKATESEQSDGTATLPKSAAVTYVGYEAKLASERLALRRAEWANESLTAEIQNLQIQILKRRVAALDNVATFTDDDLEQQLVEIEKSEDDVKRSAETARLMQTFAEHQWMAAKERLAAEETSVAAEEVEALRLSLQFRDQQIAVYNAELERLGEIRRAWLRRFAVQNGTAANEQLEQWLDDTRGTIGSLQRDRRRQQLKIDDLREQIAAVTVRAKSAAQTSAEAQHWIRDQQEQLRQLAQLYDENVVGIESARRVHGKLHQDLRGDADEWSVNVWIRTAWGYVASAWNMELASVDGRPITVGKIVIGVVLVFFGFLLARWISRSLERVLAQRLGMPESGAAALKSMAFYVFLISFALAALRFINIPLTVFTFLGGAIAIGVGFGSQNILNNFISGLILLAERPIKVGDLIQIDDLYGNVEHIGARSTRIRTGRNLEIIVPNSRFLENNVVNLTLGDDRLRTSVSVGVAYGSPTREVTTMLKRAAEEHGRVLKKPEPFVWFMEFGDNSLNFELHFWVTVRNVTDRVRVESDVRYRIDNLFRDAGIVIAYPQCDMHVDNGRPLQIQVVPSEGMQDPTIHDGREAA